ncbi:uncharacterized protein LOC129196705 [Grus americana]|uniref:uncharacterized protein LOC129196705 n=1 Tax=Grus americana TaxID=9117 RepID=UPI002407ECF9|nr:uncharacterized protein LOC129196705 [Grus americana]
MPWVLGAATKAAPPASTICRLAEFLCCNNNNKAETPFGMRHLGCPRSPVQRQLVVGRLELCGHVLTHKPMRAVKMCTKERQKRRAEHRRNGGRPEDVADGYVTTLRFVWVGWFVVFFILKVRSWILTREVTRARWGASLSVATCKGQRWRGQAAEVKEEEVPQEGSEGGKPRAHERSEKVRRLSVSNSTALYGPLELESHLRCHKL